MTTPINADEGAVGMPDEFNFDPGDAPPSGRRGHRRLRLGLVVAVVVAVVIGAGTWFANPFASKASTLVTAQATTGTIISSVNITGSVASSTVDELDFGAAGTVSAVNVTPGATVTAGQVLATIDASLLQDQIATATANLAAAQARLALDKAGPTAATKTSAHDSVSQAQLQLATARQSLYDTNLQNRQSVAQARAAVTAAKATLAADKAAVPANPAQVAKDEQAVTSAEQAVSAAELKATVATQQSASQVSSAGLGVTAAQHAYTLKIVPTTTAQIDADKAAVDSAQQALANLQTGGTTITSPIDGTVTAVNLVVGQQVTGTNNASGGSSTSASTTTGQIEVMDLSKLQIAGQASETDIAKLKSGQASMISAAAIGSTTAVGQVCSVGIVGTQISGVTSYPVTVCLDGTSSANSGLLVGMSATAAVRTSRADNAVLVPSLAVRTTGGQSVVTVVGADGTTQTTVPVTTGITNGTQTQIVSGIADGTTVVEQLPTTTGTNRAGGGGGLPRVPGVGGGGFGG